MPSLIVVTLGVQLIQPLKNLLSGIEIEVLFPELSTTFGYVTPAGPGRNLVVFRHTGMVLFYVCILSYLVYKALVYTRQGLWAHPGRHDATDDSLQRGHRFHGHNGGDYGTRRHDRHSGTQPR